MLERDFLLVDGRKVAVDVATLTRHGSGTGKETKPQLRFDRVVVRVNTRLQAALENSVPSGVTVLFALTAPIRLAAKTAAAMEDRIHALLGRRSAERHDTFTIHRNRIRIQLVKHGLRRTPKLIGFVHNRDTDPRLLFNMTREWLDLARVTARRPANARGLVVVSTRSSACLDAYRYIHSQLPAAANSRKILMVFGDGRAELLT